MRSVLSVAVLALLNVEARRIPMRLDTTNLQFVDEDGEKLDRNYIGVRFIEEDEVKFNDQLAEEFKLEKLGDHGFLIDGEKGNIGVPLNKYSGNFVSNEDTKAYINSVIDDGELAEKAMTHESDAIEAGRDKGLDFPLTKREGTENRQKYTAPTKKKEEFDY